jgi:hypothetical protein
MLFEILNIVHYLVVFRKKSLQCLAIVYIVFPVKLCIMFYTKSKTWLQLSFSHILVITNKHPNKFLF